MVQRRSGVFTVYAIYTVVIYSLSAWLITDVLPIDVSVAYPLAGADLVLNDSLCNVFRTLRAGL